MGDNIWQRATEKGIKDTDHSDDRQCPTDRPTTHFKTNQNRDPADENIQLIVIACSVDEVRVLYNPVADREDAEGNHTEVYDGWTGYWGVLPASVKDADQREGQQEIETEVELLIGTPEPCAVNIKEDEGNRTEFKNPFVYFF